MRKIFALGVIIALVFTVVLLIVSLRGNSERREEQPELPGELQQAELRVGGAVLRVELARTPEERARGLSHRDALPEDAGMLFAFSSPAPQRFWMRDTRIPLDILWIRDGKVIGITRGVQPEPGVPDAKLRRYSSPADVNAVIEVNAGWAARHGVREGDRVTAE